MGLLSKEVAVKHMVPICRQLSTSYDAGIPIVRALDLIRDNTQDVKTRRVLQEMALDLQRGHSLGEAARAQEKYLPAYFIEILTSGEMGGRLDVMFKDIADYYEDRLKMRRMVVQMLAYPCFVLMVAWFIGSFALMRVNTIDFAGGTSLGLEECFRLYLAFQGKAMLLVGLIAIGVIALSRFGLLGYSWGWISHHIWPFRSLARKMALSRFFRSLSLLIGSGMPIGRCVQHAAAVTANPYMEKDLLRSIPYINDGATLVQAFGASKTLPRMAREMLSIGEESGKLEEALRKVSQYFLEEVSHLMQKIARLMPAIIMLMVGGFVGYIVISFYLSYFSLLDQF